MAKKKPCCENCRKTEDVFVVEDCFPDGSTERKFICKKCFSANRDPCPIKFYTVVDFSHKKVRIWDSDETVREKVPKRYNWLKDHKDMLKGEVEDWMEPPHRLSSEFISSTREKHGNK